MLLVLTHTVHINFPLKIPIPFNYTIQMHNKYAGRRCRHLPLVRGSGRRGSNLSREAQSSLS